jgi:hypothetical protein
VDGPGGAGAGNDYTFLSLSSRFSGPIRLNKTFYNVSFQLDRNARNNQTLLTTRAPRVADRRVAMDSVDRFVGILNGQGIPTLAGQAHANRVNTSGRLFGSIDFSPPSSSSGQSVGITFNSNWNKTEPGFGEVRSH